MYTSSMLSNCPGWNVQNMPPFMLFTALLGKPTSQSMQGVVSVGFDQQCAKCQRPISLLWPTLLGPPVEP